MLNEFIILLLKMIRWLYREIGEFQNTSDWYLSVFLLTCLTCCSLTNVYMNWDEYKLEDPPGLYEDTSRITDEELGIPPDDLGYAPLRKELLKDGKLLDIRPGYDSDASYNRFIYHYQAVKRNLPNPYDM